MAKTIQDTRAELLRAAEAAERDAAAAEVLPAPKAEAIQRTVDCLAAAAAAEKRRLASAVTADATEFDPKLTFSGPPTLSDLRALESMRADDIRCILALTGNSAEDFARAKLDGVGFSDFARADLEKQRTAKKSNRDRAWRNYVNYQRDLEAAGAIVPWSPQTPPVLYLDGDERADGERLNHLRRQARTEAQAEKMIDEQLRAIAEGKRDLEAAIARHQSGGYSRDGKARTESLQRDLAQLNDTAAPLRQEREEIQKRRSDINALYGACVEYLRAKKIQVDDRL